MLDIKLQQLNDDVVAKKVDNPQMTEVLKLPWDFEGSEGSDQLALFERDEIQVGALVGSGSFSEVFEISGFDLKKNKKSSGDNSKSLLFHKKSSLSSSRRRKRQHLLEEHERNAQDLYTGKALKSRFVIKQLHQKLMEDPRLFRRAVRDLATEVAIMSSLEHPHIAQLHATALGGTDAMVQTGKHDSYFIVLDRLVQTLDDRIAEWNHEKIQTGPSYYLDNVTNHSRMSLKANYALQIASALQHLHERRIVFRDLKPQNIGFKEVHPDHPERDVLALFDFGLSRKLPDPEKANSDGLFKLSMVGTRRYMAPEVVISKWYDERADVYSFALVFYELTCQSRPFEGIQREEHKQFVCKEGKRPRIYSYFGFPKELERLLRFAWAQDISKRVSMKQVCATLEKYLAGTIHEGCVRKKNESTPATRTIHDSDTASIRSENTEVTEQSVSTTTSLDDTKQSTKDDAKVDSVPQAIIAVTSNPTPSTEEGLDSPRRLSFCEQIMGSLRKSILKRLRKCFDRA